MYLSLLAPLAVVLAVAAATAVLSARVRRATAELASVVTSFSAVDRSRDLPALAAARIGHARPDSVATGHRR